jgi:hypothetical protein
MPEQDHSPASFLDTLPFDWSRPQATRLRDALANVFPLAAPVIEIAARAGIPPATVRWEQPMRTAWRDLITTARNRGRLRELLALAAAAHPGAAAALRNLGCLETADYAAPATAPHSTANPSPRRTLTDTDIAQALQPFHPQASTDDLEDYARRLLGEIHAGLQSGAHVCICGRAPDGTPSSPSTH